MSVYHPELEDDVISETQEDIREPSMYKVLLHNDDYTTMDFVVEVLMGVFNKSFEDATRIMLSVHQRGTGLCGVYTLEVAETKVDAVDILAKDKGFPLRCTMEEE